MPKAAKRSDNMTKHTTEAEETARAKAEGEVLPDRGGKLKLRKPAFVKGNKVASGYWNKILKSMEGLVLLDDLDSEMLAGYCAMLARRDQSILLVNQLMSALGVYGAMDSGKKPGKRELETMSDAEFEASAHGNGPTMTPDEILEAVSKLDTLTAKLQALERNILQYADKLGLTPSGRVRLAQKRAEKFTETDPDGDLYGD